jgi:hypothetical protein
VTVRRVFSPPSCASVGLTFASFSRLTAPLKASHRER